MSFKQWWKEVSWPSCAEISWEQNIGLPILSPPPPMELCVTMVPFALRGLGLLNVAYIKALVLMCFIFFTVAGTDDCATLVREVFFGGNFLM